MLTWCLASILFGTLPPAITLISHNMIAYNSLQNDSLQEGNPQEPAEGILFSSSLCSFPSLKAPICSHFSQILSSFPPICPPIFSLPSFLHPGRLYWGNYDLVMVAPRTCRDTTLPLCTLFPISFLLETPMFSLFPAFLPSHIPTNPAFNCSPSLTTSIHIYFIHHMPFSIMGTQSSLSNFHCPPFYSHNNTGQEYMSGSESPSEFPCLSGDLILSVSDTVLQL